MKELMRMCQIATQDYAEAALSNFNMTIFEGEIVYLIGMHGSGKRIVKRILEGKLEHFKGSLYLYEEKITALNKVAAAKAGFFCIDSKQRLVDTLSISENIFSVRAHRGNPFLYNTRQAEIETAKLLEMVDLSCPPSIKIYSLTPFEQHLVCFAKAYATGAKLIMVDCVFGSYNYAEICRIKLTIQRFAKIGVSFLIIDEKVNELTSISDKVVFIKKGKDYKLMFKEDIDHEKMIKIIDGTTLPYHPLNTPPLNTKTNLEIAWQNKSFASAKQGEIVGFYDAFWESQKSALEYFSSLIKINHAEIRLNGSPIHFDDAKALLRQGVVYMFENSSFRLLDNLSIADNLTIPLYKKVSNPFGVVNTRIVKHITETFLKDFNIVNNPAHVGKLSILQQKFLSIYRWILLNPALLILEDPFIGLDMISQKDLIQYIQAVAEKGIAVIITSKNLTELNASCRHIISTNNACIHVPKQVQIQGLFEKFPGSNL